MRFIIFASIFLTVFALLNLYIVKRFINKLHIQERYKKYIKLFLLFNFLGIIGYMFARYNPTMPNWLFFLLSLPIGVVFLIFCTAVLYDISHFAIKKISLSNSRREFLKKTLDYSSLAVAIGVSGRAVYEVQHVVIERVTVPIDKLKQEYKIVQLSDVHIGGLIDKEYIQNMVKRVNALEADLVVITGDLVDISLKYAKPILAELKNLNSRYGTFFVIGNHEYFHGVESIIDEVKSLGITVLENENIFIGEKEKGFNLAGVYDLIGYRMEKYEPDLEKALQMRNENAPTLLLAHQPRFMNEVTKDVDLVLSGHTHGGQLYPFRILVSLQQHYVEGLYRHNETTQIYVNRGTGFWGPPMRLGSSPEISEITIVPS